MPPGRGDHSAFLRQTLAGGGIRRPNDPGPYRPSRCLADDDLCPCLESRRPRGSASAGCGAVSCVWLGARVSEGVWVGIAGLRSNIGITCRSASRPAGYPGR